jgi:hypothetical protein
LLNSLLGERLQRNCERFAEFNAAGRLAPKGGKRVCESCQWHPRNSGSVDACPFWRAFTAQAKADFVCQTHALLALTNTSSSVSHDDDADTVPVRIDWQSFIDCAPDCGARPHVRRTASEVIVSAKRDHSASATPPPTPHLSETRRWTADAKRDLIAWIAKAWGCDASRLAVMDHVAPKEDAVFFDPTFGRSRQRQRI